jgi:hypothetical protein
MQQREEYTPPLTSDVCDLPFAVLIAQIFAERKRRKAVNAVGQA